MSNYEKQEKYEGWQFWKFKGKVISYPARGYTGPMPEEDYYVANMKLAMEIAGTEKNEFSISIDEHNHSKLRAFKSKMTSGDEPAPPTPNGWAKVIPPSPPPEVPSIQEQKKALLEIKTERKLPTTPCARPSIVRASPSITRGH